MIGRRFETACEARSTKARRRYRQKISAAAPAPSALGCSDVPAAAASDSGDDRRARCAPATRSTGADLSASCGRAAIGISSSRPAVLCSRCGAGRSLRPTPASRCARSRADLRGSTLAWNCATPAEVDAAFARAMVVGAKLLCQPEPTDYGGYRGTSPIPMGVWGSTSARHGLHGRRTAGPAGLTAKFAALAYCRNHRLLSDWSKIAHRRSAMRFDICNCVDPSTMARPPQRVGHDGCRGRSLRSASAGRRRKAAPNGSSTPTTTSIRRATSRRIPRASSDWRALPPAAHQLVPSRAIEQMDKAHVRAAVV